MRIWSEVRMLHEAFQILLRNSSTCRLTENFMNKYPHFSPPSLMLCWHSYLFPGPPSFPHMPFSRFGKQAVIVMITHLNVFIILITTVYAAETKMGSQALKPKDLKDWITKFTQNSSTIFSKVTNIKLKTCTTSLFSAFCGSSIVNWFCCYWYPQIPQRTWHFLSALRVLTCCYY